VPAQVDTDFFLNSVAITQHNSPVLADREASFPVANRPTTVRPRARLPPLATARAFAAVEA